ncbi:MAG: ABC transporter permease subunit [Bacillota bacterium]
MTGAPITRGHVALTIAGRDLRSHLFGFSLYLAVSLVLLGVSHFAMRNALWQVEQNGLIVLGSPISYPFFLAMWLLTIYLGLMAAVAIARERDSGTLEVLFYGPVDGLSYLAGKFLQPVASFAVVMLFYLLYFGVTAAYTNLGFPGQVLQLLLLSLALAGCVVALGLAVSALSRRVFISVLVFLGLMLFFTLFDVAHAVLMAIPGERLTDLLAFARMVVDSTQQVMAWISPVEYYSRGSAALLMGERSAYLVALGSSVLYTAVLMALAAWIFQRKGVRR